MNIPDVFLIVSGVYPVSCVHEHILRVPDCELCEVLLLHVFMNIPDVFLIVSCVKYACFMCS